MKIVPNAVVTEFKVGGSWSGAFFGAVLALAAGLFFLLLGHALGFSPHNIIDPVEPFLLRVVSGVYVGITLLCSYLVGGVACNGGREGLTCWALVTVSASLILSFGFPGVVGDFVAIAHPVANWMAAIIVFFGAGLSVAGARQALFAKKEVEKRRAA